MKEIRIGDTVEKMRRARGITPPDRIRLILKDEVVAGAGLRRAGPAGNR